MFMVASSVVSTILILNYHHRNADTHEMSEWVSEAEMCKHVLSNEGGPVNIWNFIACDAFWWIIDWDKKYSQIENDSLSISLFSIYSTSFA